MTDKRTPKKIWVVLPVVGKTKFPVIPAVGAVTWTGETPDPGETRFVRFATPCVGCRGCELVCSFYKEKKNNPALSRIRIRRRELEWIERKTERLFEQKICRQCPGIPECMIACSVGAISRHPETGAIVIDDKLCIRCKKCVAACPFDSIWYSKEANKVLKCDLCDGKPKCVLWCPVDALKLERIL